MQTYPKIIDYIPLPLFTHLLTATLLITISGSVSMSLFVLFCFVFRFHIWVKPYGICVCLPDFFHLAYYPVRPAMFLHRARFHSFLLPCNISVCVNHIFFIHTSMDGHLGWNIFQKRSDTDLNIRRLKLYEAYFLITMAWNYKSARKKNGEKNTGGD